MSSFKSGRLSSLLLIGLLAWIAFVLIAPQIDLEDAAFRSKETPLAIQALTHHAPQEISATIAPYVSPQPADSFDLVLEVLAADTVVEAPPASAQFSAVRDRELFEQQLRGCSGDASRLTRQPFPAIA